MTSFVQIVVNIPAVSGVFDYAIPESLAGEVGVGHLVIVPFGSQTVQGVILRFIDQPSVREVKEVVELVDPEPVLTQAQIALAEEMAKSTLAPLAALTIWIGVYPHTVMQIMKPALEAILKPFGGSGF